MTSSTPSLGTVDPVREAIDVAARDIATSVGLTSITLRRVVSASQLTPGEVAAREPSMSALAARTFSELAAAELDRIADEVGAAETPCTALGVLVDALLGAEHDVSKTVWADAWSLGRHNDLVAEAARTSMTAWQTLLESIVEAGVASGDFATDEPELAARQFFALVDSTTAYALVGYLTSAERTRLVTHSLETSLGIAVGALSH